VICDARVEELIGQHFASLWPNIIYDVPFAIEGPPTPRGDSFAHLSVCFELPTHSSTRDGWIFVRLWAPFDLRSIKTPLQWSACRMVFEKRTLQDRGFKIIKIGVGESFDVGTDGPWWMSAVTFGFRFL